MSNYLFDTPNATAAIAAKTILDSKENREAAVEVFIQPMLLILSLVDGAYLPVIAKAILLDVEMAGESAHPEHLEAQSIMIDEMAQDLHEKLRPMLEDEIARQLAESMQNDEGMVH